MKLSGVHMAQRNGFFHTDRRVELNGEGENGSSKFSVAINVQCKLQLINKLELQLLKNYLELLYVVSQLLKK